MTPSSVIVVGAGAAGLSCALHLAERGVSEVTVLERTYPGEGSSGLSMGVFTRAYVERQDIEERVFCFEYIGGLESYGLDIVRTGYLRLARDAAAMESFERGVEINRELGQGDVRLLSPAELGVRFPHIRRDDLVGALWAERDGNIDGPQLCQTYLERGEALGVELRVRSRVIEIEGGDGKPFGVSTESGTYEADAVVNAAGPWAAEVGELLGVAVPIFPERHQVAVLRLATDLGYRIPFVMDYVPGSGGEGIFFRSEGEDVLLAGLHSNEMVGATADPDDYFRGADQEFLDAIVVRLLDRLPTLDDMGLQSGWSGLYPLTNDSHPVIGATPRPGVYVCAGLGGVGVYTSPMAGRMLAEIVVDGASRTFSGADRYALDRFAPAESLRE